eukprot:6187718-Pleurochrysis_carterae.AAC.2
MRTTVPLVNPARQALRAACYAVFLHQCFLAAAVFGVLRLMGEKRTDRSRSLNGCGFLTDPFPQRLGDLDALGDRPPRFERYQQAAPPRLPPSGCPPTPPKGAPNLPRARLASDAVRARPAAQTARAAQPPCPQPRKLRAELQPPPQAQPAPPA